jgi:hypothetical protein
VDADDASRLAVTAQVYCDRVPLSEPMICGSATETTVPLITATKMVHRRDLVGAAVCALGRNLRRVPPGVGTTYRVTLHAQ